MKKNEIQVKEVSFLGDTILAAQDEDGTIWAGVRWMCNGIGLSEAQSRNERKRIQCDEVLLKGGSNLTLPTNGGNQSVLCIALDYIPLWLAKISVTPAMKRENPDLAERLITYQLRAKDVLTEAFLPKQYKAGTDSGEARLEAEAKRMRAKAMQLNAANRMAATMTQAWTAAGIDPGYVAASLGRLYETQAGVHLDVPLISDTSRLYGCEEIAKELGIYSEKGLPRKAAVGAIIRLIDIPESEIVFTKFDSGHHEGATAQYKPAVLEKIKWWLDQHDYPTEIPKARGGCCHVQYR